MLCNKRKPLLQTKQPVHGFQTRFEKEETVVYCFLGLSCSVENRTTTSLNTHVYKYLGNVCLFPTSIGGFRETTFVYKIIFFFFQMFLQLISLCSFFIPSFFFFFRLFIYFSAFLSFLFLFEKNVLIKVPCFYLFYVKLPQQTWLPQGQYPDPYPPLHIFQSDCLVTCWNEYPLQELFPVKKKKKKKKNWNYHEHCYFEISVWQIIFYRELSKHPSQNNFKTLTDTTKVTNNNLLLTVSQMNNLLRWWE